MNDFDPYAVLNVADEKLAELHQKTAVVVDAAFFTFFNLVERVRAQLPAAQSAGLGAEGDESGEPEAGGVAEPGGSESNTTAEVSIEDKLAYVRTKAKGCPWEQAYGLVRVGDGLDEFIDEAYGVLVKNPEIWDEYRVTE